MSDPTTPSALVVLSRSATDIYLTIDSLPGSGDKVLIRDSQILPGGVNGNYASHLARLGTHTTVVGSATTDTTAQLDLDDLRSHGARLVLDDVTAGPGNVCHILLPAGGQRAILINVASDEDNIARGLRNSLASLNGERFDLAYLGVWNERLNDNFPALRRRATLIAVTVEASAWPADLTTFPFQDFDVIFCADETFDTHSVEFLTMQQEAGFTLVVTRGEHGSDQLVGGQDWVKVPAAVDDRPVIDTTGAGDCFAAAYTHGLLQGLENVELLTYANQIARTAVTVIGGRLPKSVSEPRVQD